MTSNPKNEQEQPFLTSIQKQRIKKNRNWCFILPPQTKVRTQDFKIWHITILHPPSSHHTWSFPCFSANIRSISASATCHHFLKGADGADSSGAALATAAGTCCEATTSRSEVFSKQCPVITIKQSLPEKFRCFPFQPWNFWLPPSLVFWGDYLPKKKCIFSRLSIFFPQQLCQNPASQPSVSQKCGSQPSTGSVGTRPCGVCQVGGNFQHAFFCDHT